MPTHSSNQRFLGTVEMANGAFLDGLDFRPLARNNYFIDGAETNNAISGIGGIRYSEFAGNFAHEALIGYYIGGNRILASTDQGQSWNAIYGDPGSGIQDAQVDIVGGPVNGGSMLLVTGNGVYGVRGLNQLQVDGGSSYTQATQALGGTLGDTSGGVNNYQPIRLAYDDVNGIFWACGRDASDDLGISYKSDATAVDTTGGWTFDAIAAGNMAQAVAVGPGPSGSTVMICVAGANTYFYADGATPGTISTSTNLQSILGAQAPGAQRQVVYNAFWKKWMILGTSVSLDNADGSSAVVFGPEAVGSSTASDYELRSPQVQTSMTSVTLQRNGGGVAVGPWCYFETDKGGSLSGILATPDMGKTWYHREFWARDNNDLAYITSMSKWDGRLVFACGSIADSFSALFATPRLEMPDAVSING